MTLIKNILTICGILLYHSIPVYTVDLEVGYCKILDPDGKIKDNPYVFKADDINDTDTNYVLKFQVIGTLIIFSSQGPYINATIETDGENPILSFTMSEDFKNVDEHVGYNEKLFIIIEEIKLNCTTGGSIALNYRQNVKDKNNHDPTFVQKSYEIKIPMPMLPTIDITSLLPDGLVAQDIDFSNVNVDFTINDAHFVISSKHIDGKRFKAFITTKNPWSLEKDTKFIITATDSGDPPRSTTVNLTIKVDGKNSINEISFSAVLYTFEYQEVDGTPRLEPDPANPVMIKTPHPVDVKCDIISGNDDGYFKQVFHPDTSLVELSVLKKLRPDVNFITLTLRASIEKTTTDAVINIRNPQTTPIVEPKFNQPYYTATYALGATSDDPPTISLDGDGIKLTEESDDVVVTLTGDQADKFNMNKNDTNNVWIINVQDPYLPEDVLKNGGDITLTLVATSSDDDSVVDESAIIINLPLVHLIIPYFTEKFYIGNYHLMNKSNAEVQMKSNITNTVTDDKTLTIALFPNEYCPEYFDIVEVETDSKKYKIIVKKLLGDDILNKHEDIVLVAEASTDSTEEHGSTTIIVRLPSNEIKFSQPSYTAEYKIHNQTPSIVMTDTIIVKGSNDAALIIAGEYNKNFKVSKSDGTGYTLDVSDTPLDDDVLKENSKIALLLQATLYDITVSATVFVTLPPKAPEFGKTLYFGKYVPSKDGTTATVEIDDDNKIQLIGDGAGNEIKATGTYANNFAFQYVDKTKSYSVTVLKVLTDTDELEEITVTMETTIAGAIQANQATLLLKLPEPTQNVIPKFDQIFYTAAYTVVDDKHNLQTDPIKIISDNSDKTQVEVSGEFSKTFTTEFDKTNGFWTLAIKVNLSSSTIDAHKDIIVVLKAVLPGSAEDGVATVKISLPEDDKKKPTLKFTHSYYAAEYRADDEPPTLNIIDNNITVASPDDITAKVTLTSDKFSLKKNSQNFWDLVVIKPLNKDDLKTLPLLIELVATQADSLDGTATLLITLAGSQSSDMIKFNQPFYTATYFNDDPARIRVDTDIIVNDHVAVTNVTVVDHPEYKDVFDLACDLKGKCELSTKTLPPVDLEKLIEIMLVLEVVASVDAPEIGQATVLVSLPLKFLPEFTQGLYKVKYTETNAKGIIEPNVIELKEREVDDKSSFEISVSDTEHFKLIEQTGTTWQLQLKDGIDKLPIKLLDQASIILNVTGKLTNLPNNEITTSLIVELPDKNTPTIKFTKTIYQAKYISGDPGSVEMVDGQKITIETEANPTDVTVELTGDYKDNFDYDYDTKGGIVTLSLKSINDSILDLAIFQVGVSARLINEGSISATVVVELPKKLVPAPMKFEHPIYTATYKKDNTLTINGDIKIIDQITDNLVIKVKVEDAYGKNFEAKYNEKSQIVTITAKEPLSNDTLNDNIVLTVIIEASASNVIIKAGLAIQLPQPQSESKINFDNTLYTATYQKNDTLLLDGIITIEDKSHGDSTIEVTIVDDVFDGNFEAKYDTTAKTVTVDVKKPLSSDILDNKVVITVNIEATDSKTTILAGLVITLPKAQNLVEVISYEHPIYTATYSKDNILTLDENIKIIDGRESGLTIDVKIISDEYDDNFEAKYDEISKSVTINVIKELSKDILDNKIVITLNIQASATGTADVVAGVAIELPKAQEGNDGTGSDDDSDNTGLIAAVIVLSLLLVAFIAGVVFIYIRKIRSDRMYNDLDDFRYEKNPKMSDTSKVEHPKRRPTGIIKYELNDESYGPKDTDVDADSGVIDTPSEARKSVVFNEQVEKLPIEARNENANNDDDSDGDDEKDNAMNGDGASDKSDSDDNDERSRV